MRASFSLAVLVIAGLVVQALAETTSDCKFGTALEWAESPNAALWRAKEQDKLVFVMHISGNFARPEFT